MIYDPFQEQAIEYINQGLSVIVSAPTGAGKTVIAEHVILDCLNRNKKAIYTAPIKALSNQKFRDFKENFPDKIGILTGDVTINASASILIMTTEIFRNKILENAESLKEYSWIIFDEIHYLDDIERGSVWEESLIFLPKHMNILGLSATIPNITQLAQWLESIHKKPIKVITEDKRPVPLHFYYQCQGKVFDNLSKVKKIGFKSKKHRAFDGRRFPKDIKVKSNKPTQLIEHLDAHDLLPCIYFVFSRKRAQYLAEEMQYFNFLNHDEREQIKTLYEDLCKKYDLSNEQSAADLAPLIERGVAYHHAGMLPTLKEVVEQLFTSRMIKTIFTTETFALGINMPARTVIFDELRKFYGTSYNFLKTRDFFQMAGRAGRRSIDTEGFVFSRINPHYISPEDLHRIIYGKPERVFSRFNASYATILNLYQKHGERLYDIYPNSFHYFQQKKNARRKAVELLKTKVNILKESGHIRKNQITEKGVFASKIYGYELVLSELYESGILENFSETELASLAIAAVFEPRKNSEKPELPHYIKKVERITKEFDRTIQRREKREKIKPLSKRCFYHLAPALDAWIKGEDFDEILTYTDSDEGEVVRYFRMSMQILREILDAPVSPALKGKIGNLLHLINRDVIDAEKQLRS